MVGELVAAEGMGAGLNASHFSISAGGRLCVLEDLDLRLGGGEAFPYCSSIQA